jgi:ribosomal protein S18 acetylase RimI-like enzyme
MPPGPDISIRTDLRPGDLGSIVRLHGVAYGRERGWDVTFEAYVAAPLADFVIRSSPRERLWVAERDGRLAGSIAVVEASPSTAQIRWLLVDPACRGSGLGRELLREALSFCRDCGYTEVMLWTEASLTSAGHLYQSAGFRKVEERPVHLWGADIVEERYEMALSGQP